MRGFELGSYDFGDDANLTGSRLEIVAYDMRGLQPREGAVGSSYSPEALELATKIRAVHERVGFNIGADSLATDLAAKKGKLYLAQYDDESARHTVGYAHTEPAEKALLVMRSLEVTDIAAGVTPDSKIATRRCRQIAAAMIYHALDRNPQAALLQIDGREQIPESRGLDFFTVDLNMGLERRATWGRNFYGRAPFVLGQRNAVLRGIRENFDIPR
jgi:hypothetical protein